MEINLKPSLAGAGSNPQVLKILYIWAPMKQPKETNQIDFKTFKKQVLNDYKLVFSSRACSVLGRREVLSGKGTFGIFGDGKELPQIAIHRCVQNGDFRSG